MSGIDVSVLIPVWDTPGAWLQESIDSAALQEGVRLEVIVVDDGSTVRGTVRTLADLTVRHDAVRLITLERNGGVGAAMQVGLEAARGRYVTAIGADDVMLPDRLCEQVVILDGGDWDLVSGQMLYANEEGTVLGRSLMSVRAKRELWYQRVFDATVMYDRRIALEVGGFPDVRAREAHGLWVRWDEAQGADRVLITDELWAIYRLNRRSISYIQLRGKKHLDRWRYS